MAVSLGLSSAIAGGDSAWQPASAEPIDGPRTPTGMADRALDWLIVNLDRFEPFQGQPKRIWRKQKALAELALISLCLHRQTAFADDPRLDRCLGLILQTHRNPVYREILFRQSDDYFTDFATDVFVPLALHACGLFDDADEWQAIQNLLDHSNILFRSRGPDSMLELIHLLDLGGFRYHLLSPATYLNRILQRSANIIRITHDETYTITHIIFYLSDFGVRRDFSIPDKQRQQLSWLVEHLLGMYVRDKHWDLVGELLICCHCLRQTHSPLYAIGWQAFLGAQRPDGAVPGPRYDPKQEAALAADRRSEYFFHHCYHTTLVATLAGALCQIDGAGDGE